MFDYLTEAQAAALLGLFGGVALGLAARIGRFCTLGAIEDVLYSSDNKRLRMWGVAVGVAIIGTHLAVSLGLFDESRTAYLNRGWNPAATVIGGLIFGYGMALAGNCGYGALARLGGGDLRSLMIVLVMGISAAIVLSGPLAHLRVWFFPVDENPINLQGFSSLLEANTGLPKIATGLIAGLVLIAISMGTREMMTSPRFIVWGAVVGLAIISGWLGTYWISEHGFAAEPVETHTFAAPLGETIFYGMTASGNTISFGVGSVLGVILGAALGSYSKGHFRWEACEDPRELRRQMGGAALMGAGAVLAFGCSVGQGISAFSVLAYSAPVAAISIFAGAALGLRQLITGYIPAE